MNDFIVIRGAKEHNLKNISLDIPKGKLVVVSGLSGSGKSSLAFDTIYAEGQRRYIESLSSYARQFLHQLQKPDVEHIEGLSPCIAIEQRSSGGNPRSTTATQTEIYDYQRLLFAKIGKAYCYKCSRLIKGQSSQEIVSQIIKTTDKQSIIIYAPVISGKKGENKELISQIRKSGFTKLRIDNKIYDINDEIKLHKHKLHNIDIIIDRLKVNSENKKRLNDSVEVALKAGKGNILVNYGLGNKTRSSKEIVFSELYACPVCGISYPEIEPRIFSFNSPYGACPACNGLGTKQEFDIDLIIPDKDKSIIEGAILPWKKGPRGYLMYYRSLLREFSRVADFDLDVPFKKLPKRIQKEIISGSDIYIWGKPFEGIIPHLERLFNQTKSDYLKQEITHFMSKSKCPVCNGSRLRKESLFVLIENKNIFQVTQMSIAQAYEFFFNLKLSKNEKIIAGNILKEILEKLRFCMDVGIGYIGLDRKSQTLSGGEAQRIKLATQIGSGLSGVIYVLDEPSIGLHRRDNDKLIKSLNRLKSMGNTLLIVEHDETTIRASDWVVDLGPGAGEYGGSVLFNGSFNDFLAKANSSTAKYLRKEFKIKIPCERRIAESGKELIIKGAREHNLKNINVKFPLGVFICVTGVSGSGKSTLVEDILYRVLSQRLYNSKEKPGLHSEIKGTDLIDKVVMVDQSPIGRTPRSNPATYTGVFTYIRELFSRLPDSKIRGFKPGRFSFNVKGGRCEACQGDGLKKIEMHFLPTVYVPCEICSGKRFNESTLEIKYKGFSISDVLEMPVSDALSLFDSIPKIKHILLSLYDVGLGYIKIGQFATTLSGGEAQRVKLASELCKKSTGKTFYVLDEPTTGLHFEDINKLLDVLQRLVDKGNSLVVIEHNLDVIKSCDYIIDLGPEGGDKGGSVIFMGPIDEIVKSSASYTAKYLKEFLK
ncbi:MAG: excinuclease ABC subunit UvrA [Candidatus Gygaella obscura]|nr:excinuclease ABC subunit UvrA [Candidatus Gygaella obscura]